MNISKKQQTIFQAAALILLILLAYTPVMKAGFIWDDDSYITKNPTLTSIEGLGKIWFEPTATPQYYPVVFTSFWVEHKLWGLHPLGYHLVNLFIHALNAVVLWLVLRNLHVPGAWLAAVVFGLHPVHVESVAWVTERKNVLSVLFYFTSFFCLIRFFGLDSGDKGEKVTQRGQKGVVPKHENPPPKSPFKKGGLVNPPIWKRRDYKKKTSPNEKDTIEDSLSPAVAKKKKGYYLIALGLFILALLSKSVTCSLPAAVLLVLWWKRGRIAWRETVVTVPFFVLGLGSGLLTAWLERVHVGAQGVDWQLSFLERCLIAGRALWFYAGKLIFPVGLTFNYPRWDVNTGLWWQHVFPVGVVLLLSCLWILRRRLGRGPLTGVLFFCGTLFPALGFFDVYPFLYSFVADHFQYLASTGLIVVAVGALSYTTSKWSLWPKEFMAEASTVFAAVIVVALGFQTWRQCHVYKDLESLWKDTLTKNPASWMAHNNLGNLIAKQGKLEEAKGHYREALKIKPDDERAYTNLGFALAKQGRIKEATAHYYQALEIKPNMAEAHYLLGIALNKQGNSEMALKHFSQAVRIKHDYGEAHENLGVLYAMQGRFNEAISHLTEAVEIAPDDAQAHFKLGFSLNRAKKPKEAIIHFYEAVRLQPDYIEALTHLGATLAEQGSIKEAIEYFSDIVRITPNSADAHMNLGQALWLAGDKNAAEKAYEKVKALDEALARELKAWMEASGSS